MLKGGRGPKSFGVVLKRELEGRGGGGHKVLPGHEGWGGGGGVP